MCVGKLINKTTNKQQQARDRTTHTNINQKQRRDHPFPRENTRQRKHVSSQILGKTLQGWENMEHDDCDDYSDYSVKNKLWIWQDVFSLFKCNIKHHGIILEIVQELFHIQWNVNTIIDEYVIIQYHSIYRISMSFYQLFSMIFSGVCSDTLIIKTLENYIDGTFN